MAKTQWIILLITALCSLVSFALIIVSFATSHWIDSEAKYVYTSLDVKNAVISYGLWGGTLEKNALATPYYFDLKMVWDFEKNQCALSCQQTADLREIELDELQLGKTPSPCEPTTSKNIKIKKELNQTVEDDVKKEPKGFINAGLWVSIVLFLALAMFFAFNCGFFSIINVIFNPVEPVFNILGLYIWNGLTILFIIIVLILYGALYETSLKYNIGITDTIQLPRLYDSEGLTNLGFSYWILFSIIFLHAGNISLLLYRRRLIEKDPPLPPPPVEKIDSTLLLY